MISTAYVIGFAIVWQLMWIVVVGGATSDWHVITTGAAFLALTAHCLLTRIMLWEQVTTIGWALAFGVIADTSLAISGMVSYQHDLLPAPAAPMWILALWAWFGCSLHLPLRFLRRKLWLGIPLGALSGAAAYYGGVKLGSIQIDSIGGYAAVAMVYAIGVPTLAWLAGKPPADAQEREQDSDSEQASGEETDRAA